eukprot:1138990-Pelagomonas_calceolata.AAC.2
MGGERLGAVAATSMHRQPSMQEIAVTAACMRRQPSMQEIVVANISSISATQPYEAFGIYAAGKVRRFGSCIAAA